MLAGMGDLRELRVNQEASLLRPIVFAMNFQLDQSLKVSKSIISATIEPVLTRITSKP